MRKYITLHPNAGGQSVVITVSDSPGEGGLVVGAISRTNDGFSANTDGRVPALDGITGATVAHVKAEIDARILAGKVSVIVSTGP